MSWQGVPTDRRRRPNADRWKRLGWWLVAGLPVVVALVLVRLENLHVPDLNPRHDVSLKCLLWLGGLLVVVGLAMAIMAIGRGRRALNTAQQRLTHSTRQAQLCQAYEIRLRSGWMIIVGTGLSILGGYLVWLVISAG